MPAHKKKIWKFPQANGELSPELLAAAGGSEILSLLLQRRGISRAEQAEAFLDPSKYQATSPMAFAEMGKAIVRITQAIAQKEKITVYGDYDVDGVTATSVMLTTLKKLGANVDFYIPNRATEGYGLNLKAVSILASKQRCKLIITCDCGISNFAEINLAKSLGVDTIIVDHHSMPEALPPAVAILHPKQLPEDHPLYHLPGVGVAYKLAEALFEDNQLEGEIAKLHDFVTLGMIADMVPLVKENRYLVQIGLPALADSPRAGIRALLDNTVKMDGTDIVGFGLAPRINAVGRLADASLAVKLMTVEDDSTARELAHQLELENVRRQELCEQIFFEADLKAKHALASGQDSALALHSESWHHGVVGIVASRLVEKYHCPVFVAELDKEEGKIKGSARGVSGIDLYEILKANEHLLTKWGGHQMAAGFSAEAANADVLCRGLVETCNRALAGQSKLPLLEIDLAINPDQVNLDLAKLIRKLGPFGMWNKKPVLAMQALEVVTCRTLGKDGKHHKLILQSKSGENQFECVYWRSAAVPEEGSEIDLAFSPDVNVFNKQERLQLVLADWRKTGEPEFEEAPEIMDFTPPVENALPAVATSGQALASISPDETNDKQINNIVRLQTEYDGNKASTQVHEIRQVSSAIEKSQALNTTSNAIEQSAFKSGLARLTSEDSSNAISDNAGTVDKDPGSPRLQTERTKSIKSSPAEEEAPGIMHGGEDDSYSPISESNSESTGSIQKKNTGLTQITFKDLRYHSSPEAVLDAAVRKLGNDINLFAEMSKLKGHDTSDRVSLKASAHLLIWQYPPSLQVFRSLLSKSQASQIYICGKAPAEDYDASTFLKRLLAMVRFAVNQRDGQAPAEKLCAGMATTKMALALGLTILKKADVIDWYAEDSVIYIDLLGNPESSFESLPEYRQLSNTLKEIREFRNWCAEAPLDEIQSELVPNSIRLGGNLAEPSQEGYRQNDTYPRANNYDRASYPSGQS